MAYGLISNCNGNRNSNWKWKCFCGFLHSFDANCSGSGSKPDEIRYISVKLVVWCGVFYHASSSPSHNDETTDDDLISLAQRSLNALALNL